MTVIFLRMYTVRKTTPMLQWSGVPCGTCLVHARSQMVGKGSTAHPWSALCVRKAMLAQLCSIMLRRGSNLSARVRLRPKWIPRSSCMVLEGSILGKYECAVELRSGQGPTYATEGRALNTTIRSCEDRIEYEVVPRQTDQCVAEWCLDSAKPVATLGGSSRKTNRPLSPCNGSHSLLGSRQLSFCRQDRCNVRTQGYM